jgi:hypothetical protein
MADETIPNGNMTSTPGAAAAAYQPPPAADPVETRRRELQGDIFSTDPVKQRAAVAEINRLARPATAADQQKAEKVAARSPAERRIAELNQAGDEGIFSKDPTKQRAAMTELRRLTAMHPEDPAHLNSAGAREQGDVVAWAESLRERFGVDRPKLHSVVRSEDFDAQEGDALAFLARTGADADTVRAIYRDFHNEADNGIGVLDDAAIARLEKKYIPVLGAGAVGKLRQWYTAVRGGAS